MSRASHITPKPMLAALGPPLSHMHTLFAVYTLPAHTHTHTLEGAQGEHIPPPMLPHSLNVFYSRNYLKKTYICDCEMHQNTQTYTQLLLWIIPA